MNRVLALGVDSSMTDMFSYSQRIQLALLVLFASLCLNFGCLIGGLSGHRPSQQQAAVVERLPGG